RELKLLAQKLEEEAKALEEEERQKEEERQQEEERRKKEKKGEETKAPEKMESKAPEKGETKAPEKVDSKAPKKRETKAPEKEETKAPEKMETEIPEDPAETEKNLILRFQIHESSQQNVAQVFSNWDRVQGTVQLPVIQMGNETQSSAKNKGQKTSKPQEKVEVSPQLGTQSKVAEGAVRDKHVGVPCLDIQVTNPKNMIREILKNGRLPTEDQMLKYLGLHPEWHPLPPPAVLSRVSYPAETPDVKGSSAKGQPVTGKAASRDKSPSKGPRDSSATRSKSTLESASAPTEFLRPDRYRWIAPAHGEVELKVLFSTKKPGTFEQTLRFELMETKRLYKLPCSGTGLYPSISQDPRLVFPQWRKTMKEDEIIFKEYVESTKQFHFGPLLCGKSREWYVLPAGPCTF
ncbi:HYDIN protein, partial [Chaetops frenatus]|nr:HYDIN protein [Chaetops frenatus]